MPVTMKGTPMPAQSLKAEIAAAKEREAEVRRDAAELEAGLKGMKKGGGSDDDDDEEEGEGEGGAGGR